MASARCITSACAQDCAPGEVTFGATIASTTPLLRDTDTTTVSLKDAAHVLLGDRGACEGSLSASSRTDAVRGDKFSDGLCVPLVGDLPGSRTTPELVTRWPSLSLPLLLLLVSPVLSVLLLLLLLLLNLLPCCECRQPRPSFARNCSVHEGEVTHFSPAADVEPSTPLSRHCETADLPKLMVSRSSSSTFSLSSESEPLMSSVVGRAAIPVRLGRRAVVTKSDDSDVEIILAGNVPLKDARRIGLRSLGPSCDCVLYEATDGKTVPSGCVREPDAILPSVRARDLWRGCLLMSSCAGSADIGSPSCDCVRETAERAPTVLARRRAPFLLVLFCMFPNGYPPGWEMGSACAVISVVRGN